MATMSDVAGRPPHIALFPGAGMGHLTPFLRLAAMLASHNCKVTLIAVHPTVSAAESSQISAFFAANHHINRLDFHILPHNPPDSEVNDPFFVQFEAISRSVHLLGPLLSAASPPISAVFSDFPVAASMAQITDDLTIPNYIVSTTSARFFSLIAYFPLLNLQNHNKSQIEIPGISPLPFSTLPPPLFSPNNLFTTGLATNSKYLPKAKGILVNSFHGFEPETIEAFNNGKIQENLPPLLPIGPLLQPHEHIPQCHEISWLDKQAEESVVYVSFGSRTAMAKEQVRELGDGLERSGCPFLWVLKTKILDKDESEEVEEFLSNSFLERTRRKGVVLKEWVNQERILSHPAIGGFVSHCGWNSVMEAAKEGVPILAWPQHGDQKINAEVLERAGLGVVGGGGWGWGGERVVKGEEIGEKIREVMEDEKLRAKARKVGEEARKAVGMVGGSSEMVLQGILQSIAETCH